MSERTVSTAQRGRMLASTIGKPVLFAVLMWLASAAGEISIPGTPVPITLQTFVMMLAGLMLSWRQAGSAVVLYLAAGAPDCRCSPAAPPPPPCSARARAS